MSSTYNYIAIEDIISDIVNSTRTIGIIKTYNQNVTDTTIISETDHNLTVNEIVTIDNVDYRVYNLGTDRFNIAVTGLSLHPFERWVAKAPYFEHGHLLEISNKLSEKDQAPETLKYQKYPLVVLLQDIDRRGTMGNDEADITLLLLNLTEPTYDAQQRLDNNFKPILYPLYKTIMTAISNSSDIAIKDSSWGNISHYYWGSELAGKNPFNDYLDAVEIKNLKLKIFKNC